MEDERYWRNFKGYWRNATNRHGIQMEHCDLLYGLEHDGGQLSRDVGNLEEADKYRLAHIRDHAEQECSSAARGLFAGYGWTDILCRYAEEPRFRREVVEMEPLTRVPEPKDSGTLLQCIHDRQAEYQRMTEEHRKAMLRETRPTGSAERRMRRPRCRRARALEI